MKDNQLLKDFYEEQFQKYWIMPFDELDDNDKESLRDTLSFALFRLNYTWMQVGFNLRYILLDVKIQWLKGMIRIAKKLNI